ncbi:MAG: flagellar basal-body rod protein FlgF [Comamonadaceae bacterium]|nr:MAG: flagellar basal-body rod protein FlgF [Comamonadaceae bacterium]
MDRLIYTAASGARALTQRQDGIANNLANANTPGYRSDNVAFRAVPVRGVGAPTRIVSLEASAGFDDASGPIEQTGRNLDVAVMGKGYLAVQAPDGTEAYTRAGALQVTDQGQLVTSAGLPVNGAAGAINIPVGSTVTIARDGTVSAKGAIGPAQTVGQLKLVNPPPADMRKGADGLLRLENGEEAPADATVRVAAGALEGSNVNVVEAMVGMIAAARQFETQMKLLQTAEQNDQRASQLLAPAR